MANKSVITVCMQTSRKSQNGLSQRLAKCDVSGGKLLRILTFNKAPRQARGLQASFQFLVNTPQCFGNLS